ncbi:MAG: asparagine synthase (glutamine-hydrolyzing) [Acidobacteria bacterium]|nr:asparagine synthase (glutamine-hydrolyzing) [Acidobacteriota bacterium]
MCSISGIFATDVIDRELVARMNAAQKHRGPDDDGLWTMDCENGHVGLGNTRLAIIDTSAAGHQPMFDPQTGNCITYNGETYNYKDLSETIRVNPRSRSDTEVVLHAYSEWGTDVFAKLRGMFALAIWDHKKRELILARDRFGIKPLYYYLSDRRLIFASELRALLTTGAIPRKLSRAGLDSYLACGSVAAPHTIVEGVQQLLPGHYLRVTANDNENLNCTIEKFANEQPVARPANRNDAVAQLRAELEESVRLHLVSDVPLGVFLSGGMDSSALVALMSEISEQRPKTFSVVFDEAELSEERHARAVAQRFQTEHSEIRLSEQQLIDMLSEALAAFDQPTMDGINTYVVSKAVKNAGVTVALSGLGGDELFAGYPSFRRALKFAALPNMPRRVLRAAAGVGKHVLNGSVRREKFWELAASDGSVEEVYQITRRLFATAVSPQNKTNGNGNTDVVNAVSRLELQGYMANTLLRDTDAMSMAHSLEVRVPFVDVKLVDYALSLPGEWKLGHRQNGVPKPLLADAIADLLPREFLARRKMGFTLPFEKWMQERMRGEISAVLEDASVREVGLEPHEVRELWRRFLQTPRAVGWSRPWSLFVLARWCAINRVAL